MYLGVESTPTNNAIIFFFNRLSFPLAFSWIVFLFRSVGREIHLLKDDLLVGFLSKIITIKGMEDQSKESSQTSIYQPHTGTEQKDGNNNKLFPQKVSTKKRQTTFYNIVLRVSPSIFLAHHFVFIYMHFRFRQAIPCGIFDMVSFPQSV